MPSELILLGSPLITGLVAVAVMWVSQRQQAYIEDAKDARVLRDATRARLASVFETATRAAVAMNRYVYAKPDAGEQALNAVFDQFDLALARLMVEPRGQPAAEKFTELMRAFTAWRLARDANESLTDVQKARTQFDRKLEEVQESVHALLGPLDEPIQVQLPNWMRIQRAKPQETPPRELGPS